MVGDSLTDVDTAHRGRRSSRRRLVRLQRDSGPAEFGANAVIDRFEELWDAVAALRVPAVALTPIPSGPYKAALVGLCRLHAGA